MLDIETLTLCRLVSKEWKDFIDNNVKLNQKQLQFGLKLARRRDFFGKSTFNAQQYRAIENMLWNPTDLKIVLQVVKEICNAPIVADRDGNVKLTDNNPLCYAIGEDNLDFIKAMAKTTFDFGLKNTNNYGNGKNALLQCYQIGNSKRVESKTCNPKNMESTQLNVLHYAVIFERTKIIDFLLEFLNSMALNGTDSKGFTPLHHACMHSNEKVILSFSNYCSNDFGNLQKILEEGQIGNAKQQYSRIDLNAKNKSGETPLILACKEGNTEAVKFLLQRSNEIDFNERNGDEKKRYAALHVACMNGHTEIVRLFLEHTKDIDFNATADDHCDSTALHLACLKGHLDIVKLLLDNSEEKGIDAMAKDKYGDTAFDSCKYDYGGTCKNKSVRKLFYERNLKNYFVGEYLTIRVVFVSLFILTLLSTFIIIYLLAIYGYLPDDSPK